MPCINMHEKDLTTTDRMSLTCFDSCLGGFNSSEC